MLNLNAAFEKLSDEKKNLIIQACIEEFNSRGYNNASTNTIIERAGISKGILFHYFGSKKSLFLFIVNHIASFFIQSLQENLKEVNEEEFFQRLKLILIIKLKTFSPYPNEYRLLNKTFTDPPLELKKEIQEMYLKMYRSFNTLNTDFYSRYMNPSKLRRDINVEQALEIINIVFDQLTQKYVRLYRGREKELIAHQVELSQELDRYIDVLKDGIYEKSKDY